jgi:hypothetical protein
MIKQLQKEKKEEAFVAVFLVRSEEYQCTLCMMKKGNWLSLINRKHIKQYRTLPFCAFLRVLESFFDEFLVHLSTSHI